MHAKQTARYSKVIEWQGLGIVPYREAWALQDELRDRRVAGDIADRLLLLEHAPVITLGRRECDGDIITPLQQVHREGIEVVKTNRGGRATYHGPGQLIGYFICKLRDMGMGIMDFVHTVEEISLRTLDDFGVRASRDDRHPGLWIGGNKIVAIGMNVSRGITQHGIAINVSCDLTAYRHIVACGIEGRGVTSIEREIGSTCRMEDVVGTFAREVGAVLGRTAVRV